MLNVDPNRFQSNPFQERLALRDVKTTKIIFVNAKKIEAIAILSEERIVVNGVGNNPLLQQSCASSKNGSKKMTPTSKDYINT